MELVMFVGIPASGKSTHSAFYREQGYLVLSSDEIRNEITGGVDQESLSEKERSRLHSQVFEIIRRQAVAALKQGRSVVVDATNLSRKRRMNFLAQFRHFDCQKKCVLFITAPEICLVRNRKRSGTARVPDSAIYRMLCGFECPNYWEGWDEIVPAADPIPYRFPFEEIQGFDQDNPHHALTLDEHIAQTVAFCREQGYGERLERVAAYHDIGKRYTKRYCNARGIPTPHAHYLGHDSYGAYLYLAEMCCGKDLTEAQFRGILYEANLINCHMRPLALWRKETTTEEKDRSLFGEPFLTDLLALHRADRAAHQEAP